MRNKQLIAALILPVILLSTHSCKKETTKASQQASNASAKHNVLHISSTTSPYWNNAQQTHNFIVGNLLTTYNSYRVNTTSKTTVSDEWYNISQIYADAAMIKYGDARYASYMNNTYTWMNHMWDSGSTIGGYFAEANIDGTGAAGDKYVDDNTLTGLAYLEAYAVTTGTTQTNYLNSAKACANWLMNNGLWDNTYGGGFWWSTAKGSKPTQSNGLAMQLFLKLYQITGQSYYLSWTNSVRGWLETTMFDSSTGLYIWKIDGAGAGTKHTEKFTYDNAIMLEADLLYSSIVGDNTYVTKAQNLGTSMNTTLWNNTYKAYIFNTSDLRTTPAWCGWGSQAMIRLYERDGNTAWLDYAQKNIDFINLRLKNTSNSGYYQFANLDGTGRYTNMEEVDQAWMQRVQVLLSNYR